MKRRWIGAGLSIGLLCAMLCGCATTSQKPGTMDEASQSTGVRRVDRGTFPFMGERLTFDVRHVATKSSVADAVAQVGYESVMADGTRYIPIWGTASSKSIVRLFARIDDRAEVYIEPSTWESVYSYKHLNENDRDREYAVWFWPEDLQASVERTQKGRVVKRDYSVPNGSMDTVAWVFLVRTFDLQKDREYTWYTFDGWTINRITLKVGGVEDVWTPGGFYAARKFEIWRERSDAITPHGALSGVYIDPERHVTVDTYHLATGWLAEAPGHVPVRLVIQTGIGEFDLILKSVEHVDKEALAALQE